MSMSLLTAANHDHDRAFHSVNTMLTAPASAIQLVVLLFMLSATAVESFSPSPVRLTAATSRRFLYIDSNNMTAGGGEIKGTSPSRQLEQKELISAVKTLDEFNSVVREERERIVVVRFHGTYCKACQAIRVAYERLVKQSPDIVKFVDVSITDKSNLGEELGIPGVPFGQIYVPGAGLVEELLMSRRHMAKFKKVLGWYVNEICDIPEEFFENPHQMDENENLIL